MKSTVQQVPGIHAQSCHVQFVPQRLNMQSCKVLQTPTNITNTYQYSESHATASREHIENIPKKIMNRSPESILHYAERRALHLGSDHLQLRGSPSWQRSAQEPVSKSSSKTIQSMRGVSRI